MKHIEVKSSNIESIAHDPDKNLLHVKFKNGSTYEYEGVSKEHHEALMSAKSIGSHIHQHIKPKFACKKLK